jgi:hypothetical protein
MQTGSSGTLIGWKSGQTTCVPLWDRMERAWLRTLGERMEDFVHHKSHNHEECELRDWIRLPSNTILPYIPIHGQNNYKDTKP